MGAGSRAEGLLLDRDRPAGGVRTPRGFARNHRKVRRQEELIWLAGHGFTRILSLLESPHNLHAYEEAGIAYEHIPLGRHDEWPNSLRKTSTRPRGLAGRSGGTGADPSRGVRRASRRCARGIPDLQGRSPRGSARDRRHGEDDGRELGSVGREIVADRREREHPGLLTTSAGAASGDGRAAASDRDGPDRGRGIRELGVHGVLPEEQTRPQPFEVDVELTVDLDRGRRERRARGHGRLRGRVRSGQPRRAIGALPAPRTARDAHRRGLPRR